MCESELLKTIRDQSRLIERIKGALDTDEDGDALVSVARDACRAEHELAALERRCRE